MTDKVNKSSRFLEIERNKIENFKDESEVGCKSEAECDKTLLTKIRFDRGLRFLNSLWNWIEHKDWAFTRRSHLGCRMTRIFE